MPKIAETIIKEEKWDEAFKEMWDSLCRNLRRPDTFFKGYRAHPGPSAVYAWDMPFISRVWLHWDTHIAEELIHYILRFQKTDGKIHNEITEFVAKPSLSYQAQPSLLAWASWAIYKKSKNLEFLKSVYPKLKLYHAWLLKERQNQDGLFFWKYPYESGIKNSPRFSHRSQDSESTKVAAVDFSSYMAMSMESLALMARELNFPLEMNEFDSQYTKLKSKMNEKLWDPKKGMYFDWDYKKNNFIHIETISSLTPMVAGIPDISQAKIMMTKILDPFYYNTTIPFPAVARSEKRFIKDMGRSPVRIDMAYLGVLGIDRYGYHQEAAYLAKKLIKGIFETKKITLGPRTVENSIGRTALVNSMLIEFGEKFSKPHSINPIVDLAP